MAIRRWYPWTRIAPVVFVAAAMPCGAASGQFIGQIQGQAHRSPHEGNIVTVDGVVTLKQSNGFYVQGATDGNDATSDGLFVFSNEADEVDVGDRVTLEGRVIEFVPPSRPSQLSLTELAEPDIVVVARGADLPQPVILGTGGRMAPTETIDDDGLASFEPNRDGIDFYESLEGMRATILDAVALSTVNSFGEVWVLASGGEGATGFDGAAAVVMTESDFNPERILVDLDLVEALDRIEAGVQLGNITGVMSYAFGNYRLLATEIGGRAPPPIHEDQAALTIGVYNVENLDPKIEDADLVGRPDADVDDDLGDGKFAAIAQQIIGVLGAPAIVALQEVQDNDGAEQTPIVSAEVTLNLLAETISSEGGPAYQFMEIPPEHDQDGGQPGANIRVAYLFDPARVQPVAGGVRRILDTDMADGDAFEATRKPLLAVFQTPVGPVTIINVHLSSRGGSDPLFGSVQPPAIGGAQARRAQTRIIAKEVDALRASDPDVQILVLGDFNAFYFEEELTSLEAGRRLTNLWRTLPETARRSYVFEGQAQALDHVLVSPALGQSVVLKAFNVNAGKLDQASDHDPLLVTIASAITPGDGPSPGGGTPITPAGLDLPEPPEGLRGLALRDWLRTNWYVDRHRSVGYSAARRAMYSAIDVAADGRVYGVYSGFSQPARDTTFLDPINAEHTVPQSWFNSRDPMRSDIHHLFPTHMDANAARGSDPFGEIDDAATQSWFGVEGMQFKKLATIPSSNRDAYAEDTGSEFEPPEAHEGNVARAVFYFYTMYPEGARSIDDIAADGVGQLFTWHLQDLPDSKEIERNDRIESVQGNRNPYVDRPELVCRAYELACGGS